MRKTNKFDKSVGILSILAIFVVLTMVVSNNQLFKKVYALEDCDGHASGTSYIVGQGLYYCDNGKPQVLGYRSKEYCESTRSSLSCSNGQVAVCREDGRTPDNNTPYYVFDSCQAPTSGGSTTGGSTSGGSTSGGSTSGGSTTGGSTQTTTQTTNANNPQTGTAAIMFAWIIGFIAVGYSVWYFKRLSTN